MAKSVSSWIERVLYGEKKQGTPTVRSTNRFRWLGPLNEPLDRFLSGGSPTDPLYLSNRPFRKKAIVAAVVVVPFVLIGTALGLSALGYFSPKTQDALALTPAEVAQRMLPDMDKLHIENNSEIQVVEIRFEHGANPNVYGTLKNNSGHTIHSGEAIFDLANEAGSQVGRFTTQLTNLAPDATMSFRSPLKDRDAIYALLREVNTK